MKRLVVAGLERLCTWTHPVTMGDRRLSKFPYCPFGCLSDSFDQGWGTSVWEQVS